MAITSTQRRHAQDGRRMQELEMDTSIAPDVALLAGMGPETHLDTGWDSLLLRPSSILTSALGGLTLQHWLVENAAFASIKHQNCMLSAKYIKCSESPHTMQACVTWCTPDAASRQHLHLNMA